MRESNESFGSCTSDRRNTVSKPCFIDFGSRASFELAPGVRARPLFGDGAMMNLLDFEPNAGVPTHSHPHEQIGIVLRGIQILTVDGVEHALGEMEGYVLPSGLAHAGRGGP